MLILSSPRFSIDRFLSLSAKTGGVSLAVFLLIGVVFSLVYPLRHEELSDLLSNGQKSAFSTYTHESIGLGGLTIHPHQALGWVSRIADEMSLLAFNARPDVPSHEIQLLLQLKSTKEQVTVLNGKSFFLKERQEGKGLEVSREPSGIWIQPILLDGGTVLVEVGRELSNKEGAAMTERGQFFLTAIAAKPAAKRPSYFQELSAARFFASDLLIQKYGGSEYAAMRQKGTLEVTRNAETYGRFISSEDYLLYENGKWAVVPFDCLRLDAPIARIRGISQKSVEIQLWDETGFYPSTFQLAADPGGRLPLAAEMLPAKVRLRSATQVSCVLGKRRVVLRTGDWMLHTPSGWRTLRRYEEVENCLLHQLKGELLVFDAIEKEQGKLMMKGHLFDETRVHSVPFSIPIEADKSETKPSRRKPLPTHMRATS